MRIVTIGLVLALAGCAQPVMVLERFDGAPMTPAEREQATAECKAKGELAKLNVRTGSFGPGPVGDLADVAAWRQAREEAIKACMAEKGIRVTMQDAPPATSSIKPQ